MRFPMLCRAALALSLATCALDSTGPTSCKTAADKVNNAATCSKTQQSMSFADDEGADTPE